MLLDFETLIKEAKSVESAVIAVPEAHDPDVLEGLSRSYDDGLITSVFLIGDQKKIELTKEKAGCDLKFARCIPTDCEQTSIREAINLIRDGKADFLMKGKLTTANLIRAVLDRQYGLRTEKLLSQVIVFQVPGISRLMIMTDAAINIAPNLDEKAGICRNAVDVAHALGIKVPKVALLTALEFVNSAMPATVDAAILTQMNRRGQIPGAYLEGPIGLDVPLSKFAADRKGIQSPLVEATDIFVAPNIEAANILYRSIIYFAYGISAGIIMGATTPLLILSRAEPPETKMRSIALALVVNKFLKSKVNDK